MQKYNRSINIYIVEMLMFFLLHILYADENCSQREYRHTIFWAIFFTCAVLAVRFGVKERKKALFIYCMIPFLATYCIGKNTRTLAFGFLIYLITDIMFSVVMEERISLFFIVATNISFVCSLVFYYDMVTTMIPMPYFWLVVLCTNAGLLSCAYVSHEYSKRQEENEHQNEQLLKAQVSKDEFLANMSHEIRTPMNSVCGMTELMLRDTTLSDESREYAQSIQSAGKSLLGIINDILDFSKIESGKMQLNNEPYNFCSMLNDIIVLAMARKGNKNLELIIDCDPNIPSELIGDDLRIKQVIINLMTNAIKFTEEGAVLLKIRKRDTATGINLTVSVKDTGIGIKQQNIEKLFQSFQQVDTKKNRKIEGTGLGLAICQRIVDMMDGFFCVESEYGKGSEFRFTIPQRIHKETPCIQIQEADKMEALTYLAITRYENEQTNLWYRKLFAHLMKDLGVKTTEYLDIDEFQRGMEGKNPETVMAFTAYEEYLSAQEYFDKLSETYSVVVVMDKEIRQQLPAGIKVLYKPFYALSIANVINHKKNYLTSQNEVEKEVFIAPKAKVLVVDDNPMNLKVTKGLLGPYQVQTTLVQSGQEAINLVEKQKFDLIFMDHMMPGMDGVEAAEHIRNFGGWRSEVPIVALTANAIEGVREMFISKGFQDFVAKPIEISQLERALKKWIPQEYIMRNESVIGKIVKDDKILSRVNFQVIDKEVALSYFDGREENYIEALRTYLELGEENISMLQMCYKIKAWQDYTVKVHALKSTSLTVGAVALSELARDMEEAAGKQDEEFVKKHQAQLVEMYREVLKDIQEHLPKEEQNQIEQIEISTEELKERFDELAKALEEFDVEVALEKIDELKVFCYEGHAMELCMQKTQKAVDGFDFEEAKMQLASVRERIFT